MSIRQPDDPKAIAAWALYDWANSPFTTLVVTFIYATYFTRAMAPDEILGTAWWSRGVSLSAFVVALVSPVLGTLADRGGLRRPMMLAATFACIAATASLTYVAPNTPNAVLLSLTLFILANIGFEFGMVFYNSLLPTVASPAKIGRVSGYGWGLGYVGGLVCLIIALAGFVQPEIPWFGVSRENGFNIRATNLLVAVWFAVFSIPMFLLMRGERRETTRVDVLGAFGDLWRVLQQIRRYREAAKFLLARLIYNDGLITIFAFGGIYAGGTFGLDFAQILMFGIVINIAAGIGAFAFGFVDDRIGGKSTVLVSITALTIATGIAVWAPSTAWLWTAGIMIGTFAGPVQSASRSLMGRFVPPDRQTEFFGFYALSGKFTAFLGPLILGAVTLTFNSQRAGVATLLVFFVVGGLLLTRVDEKAGAEASERPAISD